MPSLAIFVASSSDGLSTWHCCVWESTRSSSRDTSCPTLASGATSDGLVGVASLCDSLLLLTEQLLINSFICSRDKSTRNISSDRSREPALGLRVVFVDLSSPGSSSGTYLLTFKEVSD